MERRPRAQGDSSEAELRDRFRAGDEDAFRALMEAHLDAVYRLALHLLGDEAGAEDAAQEAFVRAYQRRRRFDPRRAFGPWVRGIAANVCRDELRRRARRRRVQPETQAARADARASEVTSALRELPEQYQAPLTMFYIEETSVREIADALGMREGTVRVRLHRGREMLRQRLREREER